MTKWCVVPNCRTGSRTEVKRSVFRVPKDAALWKKWEEAIPGIIKLNQNDVVCERHFTEKDISREWIKRDANGKVIARATYKHPQLQKLAVPSKFGNSLAGITNCVPMHEYAKPLSDSQMESAKIANQGNAQFPSVSTPEIQRVDIFINAADVSHSSPAISANICKEEPCSIEVADKLPVAETLVSPIHAKMSVSMEKNKYKEHNGLHKWEKIETFPIKIEDELIVAETFVSRIPPKEPSMEISKRKSDEDTVINCDFSTYIPEGWGWVKMHNEIVHQALFTYAVTKVENGVHCPVVQKAVTLDAKGTLQYFIYGRHIDSQGKNLEQTLSSEKILKDVLLKFKGTSICNGMGDVDVHLVRPGTAYQDYVNKWRSKACSLISQKKRCESCTRTRKCIQQRIVRLKNSEESNFIGDISNPIDQRKLSAMRMKLRRERRQKIRAQERVKHLTTCIKTQCHNN